MIPNGETGAEMDHSEVWQTATKLYGDVALGRSVRDEGWIRTVHDTPSPVLITLLVLLGTDTNYAMTTGARAAVQAVLADRSTRAIQRSGTALTVVGIIATVVLGVAEIAMPLWYGR